LERTRSKREKEKLGGCEDPKGEDIGRRGCGCGSAGGTLNLDKLQMACGCLSCLFPLCVVDQEIAGLIWAWASISGNQLLMGYRRRNARDYAGKQADEEERERRRSDK
jgi:hypothetical protein